MFETLEKIRLNIDKTTWETVKFGDVAREIRESVKDPTAEGLERIVGLEHIEPENIHLKAWGSINDGTTFTRRFRKGQVLFGRRRAYLKKAALAEFDGLCSGDIIVMEAKDELLPKLLPFIVQNDRFFEFAVKNSAGSLSPRVKFKDLVRFEFRLPPKEQQAQIAELLWAGDEVLEKNNEMEVQLATYKQSLFKESVYILEKDDEGVFGNLKPKWTVKYIGDIITKLQYGISESLDDVGEIPVLRMNNLNDGRLDLNDLKYLSNQNGALDNFILEKGDILFNRTNSYDLVGKVGVFDEEGAFSFASYLIRIKVDKKQIDPRVLNFYLNTNIGIAKIRKYRTPGVSQSNINAQNLKSVPVPVPPMDFQVRLMNKLDSLEVNKGHVRSQRDLMNKMLKILINQIF